MSEQTPTPAAAPAAAAAAPAAEGAAPAGPSKSELKKRAKEAEKAKKAAERAAREEEERKKRAAADAVDNASQNYGKLPLHQSQERTGREYIKFDKLTDADVGKEVVFRARIHNTRPQGAKIAFLQFRQQIDTLQGVLVISKEDDPHQVSKQMLKYALGIPLESIVTVEGVIKAAEVKSCTVQKYEVAIRKLYTVTEAQSLPFSIADASRDEADFKKAEEDENLQYSRVSLTTRLDNRIMDLRTPANQAIFRMQHGIGQLFRNELNKLGFTEIHTPKLQGAATESGASVFKVKYFDGEAFLAQSPQLAKQMCIAADMERVYEVAPVFRAENSNTHRHMTEFMGLDLEMAITEHYHEAMHTIDTVLKAIFNGLKENYATEIEIIKKQFPVEDFVVLPETPVITFAEGIKMLQEAGAKESDGSELLDDADLSTENEKFLGRLMKEKTGADYYIVDKFPAAFRPFYSMPDPTDPTRCNSYDYFMRGEEILSGAQRIHDPEFLTQRLKELGMNPDEFKDYIDAFRLGCPPHAGGGIGLERVLMFYLGLGNIRRASLFPRDPKRLRP